MADLILETLRGLANLPDLIVLTILLVSAILGGKRGLVRTVVGGFGRLIALIGAIAAARFLAPLMAKVIVTPIVGDIFRTRAAVLLQSAPDAAESLQSAITEMAAGMAESLAYFLLFVVLLFLFGILVHMLGSGLKLLTRIAPVGALDSLAGFVLGAAFGLVLIVIALRALTVFSPNTFGPLGWLSPETVAGTLLTRSLLSLLPVTA